MKETVKIQGQYELDKKDLHDILLSYATRNREELTKIIIAYFQEVYGYTQVRLQYPADGLDKIVAIINSSKDEGAKPIGTVKTLTGDKASNKGFTRTWNGLYREVGDIIDVLRKRKKSFVSYEDLLAELLDLEDNKGKKLFVKDGQELPMPVLKQRLAESQVKRQAKSQPNLRGVKVDKKNGGLSF